MMCSGSAPLSPQVMTFFRCLLGVPVVEGYGQTEASAAATFSHLDDLASVGHVGGPHGAMEFDTLLMQLRWFKLSHNFVMIYIICRGDGSGAAGCAGHGLPVD